MLRARVSLSLLLLACLSSPLTAQGDTVFSFLRLPMGSAESALHERFSWGCRNLPQTPEGLDMFLAEKNCSPIDDPKAPGGYNLSAPFPSWAGIRPRYFTLYYWQDKLSLVRVVFHSGFFPSVLETLEARYGKPRDTTIDTVRTRIGGVFPARTSRWEAAGSAITAHQYSTSIDESEVWYTLTSWDSATVARRKQRAREKLP